MISECACIISWYEDTLKRMRDYPKYLRSVSDLGRRFSQRTFGNLDTLMDVEARNTARNYAQKFNDIQHREKNGIVFLGGCGIGKTHLAAAISNFLIDNMSTTVIFGTQVELLEKIRNDFSNRRDDTKRKMKTLQLLVIDDFGKEKSSEWVNQTMFEIINARYENKMPMIITTNLTADELAEKYGNAITSRLIECCKWVSVGGTDRRR